MKKLILALVTLAMSLSFGQDQAASKIDEMIQKFAAPDYFSGVVLVAKDGQPIFSKAYGFADKEQKISNSLNTRFSLASVGKLFTTAAIVKLAENGKLTLDDPIDKHLHGFQPAIGRAVTIRHLLTIQSGFRDVYMTKEFNANPSAYESIDNLVKLIRKEELLFTPGTNTSYSNSGFILLSAIIEKTSGKPFADYIQESVLKPAGATHSLLSIPKRAQDIAVNYRKSLQGIYSPSGLRVEPSGAGFSLATAGDLLLFTQALCYSKAVIGFEGRTQLLNNFAANPVSLRDLLNNPKSRYGREGMAEGISTVVNQLLKDNYTIIVLSNYSAPIAETVAANIENILKGKAYTEPQLPLAEALFQFYSNGGITAVKENFPALAATYHGKNQASILNNLGYRLITENNQKAAEDILLLNTQLFPNDANAFDSYGEILMLNGKKTEAIGNYEKSVKMDPANQNAIEMIKKLKAEQ